MGHARGNAHIQKTDAARPTFYSGIVVANIKNGTITTHGKFTPCQTDMASIPAAMIFPEKYFSKYKIKHLTKCWKR